MTFQEHNFNAPVFIRDVLNVGETGSLTGIQCGSFRPDIDGITTVYFQRIFRVPPVVTVSMKLFVSNPDFTGITNNAIICEIFNHCFTYKYGVEYGASDESRFTINWIAMANQ
jgi:hypothetical protein